MKSCFNFKSGNWKSLIPGLFFLLTFTATSLPAQTLTVQSPNGGEFWSYGQTEIVTWTGENLSGEVKIEFSNDGGTNWYYIGNVPTGPNGGSATVGVPAFQTTNGLVKISDVGNTAVTDMSDEPFTIYFPPILIWSPQEGDVIFNNSESSVFWVLNTTGINFLNAELSNDNGQTFTLIGENINAQAGYTFLYFSTTPSDSCIIRLYNVEDPSEFGLSEVFTISPPPGL